MFAPPGLLHLFGIQLGSLLWEALWKLANHQEPIIICSEPVHKEFAFFLRAFLNLLHLLKVMTRFLFSY